MSIRKALRWLPALVWMGIIFVASASPDALGGSSFLDFPGADKLVHAAVFGVLAALLFGASGNVLLALWVTCAYGVSDEIHQSFVHGRVTDTLDLLADVSGAALALMLVVFLTHTRLRIKKPLQ